MLKANDQAPLDIKVLDQNGETSNLRHLLGQKVLLYFYPRDNTPGCTLEACNFRDANSEISAKNIQIIGVSQDSLASHEKFANKHQLNFPLWSDPDHQLMVAFGAWGEKKLAGRKYFGTIRSTFLINENGQIVKTWPKVKSKTHAQEVLEFIEQTY